MNHLRIPYRSQKGIAHLFLLITIVAAIALGIYLVKNPTNLFPQAGNSPATPETSFSLQSSKQSVKLGEDFKVDVLVSSDIDSANLFTSLVSYPTDKLEVVRIDNTEIVNSNDSSTDLAQGVKNNWLSGIFDVFSSKAQAQTSNSPTGYIDNINKGSCTVSGWAKDGSSPNTPLNVHIYKNGEAGKSGTYITQGKANLARGDNLPGYTIRLPEGFSGDIYVHILGVNSAGVEDGENPPLPVYTPAVPSRTLNCDPPSPPPTTPPNSPFQYIGTPEAVFNWERDHCSTWNVPDLAARAYRSADGKVNLTLSSDNENRRMRGSSLNDVRVDCQVHVPSHRDTQFNNFNYDEWLAAPYTEDGNTVYGINHNEWYGFLSNSACDPNERVNGWVNSLNMMVSGDGGASFSHPADYVIRKPSVAWSNNFGCTSANRTQYGSFTPSNIIKKDNYYYLFFHDITPPGAPSSHDGICLMRTQDLSNASSWEVYTATGTTGFVRSKDALCNVVLPSMAPQSVTFNTYLNKYILTGPKWGTDAFWMVTSDDLVHWAAPIKLMDAPPSFDGWWKRAYPAFIDPNSTSRNFETSGQEVYLYYMEYIGGSNRNLMRQKIQFLPAALSSPNPSGSVVIADYFVQTWIEKQDDRNGTISLVGAVPNPGIKTRTGSKVKMATITFKAKAIGDARLDFEDGTAIYRNSDNQNILGVTRGVKVLIGGVENSSTPNPSSGECRAIGCAPPPTGCNYQNGFTSTCNPAEYAKLTCGNLICVGSPSPKPSAPSVNGKRADLFKDPKKPDFVNDQDISVFFSKCAEKGVELFGQPATVQPVCDILEDGKITVSDWAVLIKFRNQSVTQ